VSKGSLRLKSYYSVLNSVVNEIKLWALMSGYDVESLYYTKEKKTCYLQIYHQTFFERFIIRVSDHKNYRNFTKGRPARISVRVDDVSRQQVSAACSEICKRVGKNPSDFPFITN